MQLMKNVSKLYCFKKVLKTSKTAVVLIAGVTISGTPFASEYLLAELKRNKY